MLIEVREEQPEKAYSPMLVTPLGMVTEVREEQSLKVPPAINRVFSLIVYAPDFDIFAPIKQLSIYNTSFSQFDSSLYMPVPLKARYSIRVTLLGIVMEVREEQLENV